MSLQVYDSSAAEALREGRLEETALLAEGGATMDEK